MNDTNNKSMITFTKEQSETINKIYNHYGTANQVLHCGEELSELNVELLKFVDEMMSDSKNDLLYTKRPKNFEAISEEIADVLICIEKLGPALDWDLIRQYVDFKLNRQTLRMQREENND